ncbi:hypothetical protein F5878DRAFT_616088 [Lentinula raphanica]|uniref:Uncharacterized protein n=1 Tax=Lentinula raphanica TaxID=153919 RepID=A0AA38PAX1_9AGAR|nr:hypothetical protein F5880DRAFT_1543785 [Lentinula raphanica]KAJ3839554.1 hypothetical protein F5878DRAFT_616088 [Lentinula raphanica]
MRLQFIGVIMAVIMSCITQVYAPPALGLPPKDSRSSRSFSSVWSLFRSNTPPPADTPPPSAATLPEKLTIQISYVTAGEKELPTVNAAVEKLIDKSSRRLGFRGPKLIFHYLNQAQSNSGEVRFNFWSEKPDPEIPACSSTRKSDEVEPDVANQESKAQLEKVPMEKDQKVVQLGRNCEGVIENFSKSSTKNVKVTDAENNLAYGKTILRFAGLTVFNLGPCSQRFGYEMMKLAITSGEYVLV